MTHRPESRRGRQIVAALAGVSLLLSAVYMLYQGSVRMYYDYYFFAHVKEHYIAPPLRYRVIDAVVLVSLFLALYVAYRLLRHSFVAGAQPASDQGTSLMLAVVIVAVAMAGAIWLQDYRQFPWIVFMAVFFPAQIIVVMAAGGPHEASGETWVDVATLLLATAMWYGLIEIGRRWWLRRNKRNQWSHSGTQE